jgi:phosphate starvation-inducible PhoH-like protein
LARRQLTLDNDTAAELAGSEDAVLRELEDRLGCDVFLRGNVLTLDGEDADVRDAATIVDELVGLVERGHELAPATVDVVSGAADEPETAATILEDTIWSHRATKVAPKTVNQKRYVDSIRQNTITFGIGPAGTGKTFLAVASAAESSSLVPPWRRASGWASCPATSRPRSTRTCARSSTPSTTCSTRRRS